ncbi:outer membrane efflux protein [Fluviicoccus keumensis]|uniref:Outer membrane efflux protein n=1 Tax=Fluviicoccus keumensis TaxID=1435465 RepID=A0A4Q7Z9M4_9GAMM|nr:TolC family protein [Fluviicoccus keumensis]RZU47220.1 outer membrane efflux protein [Fluviicoccus keumensis]
MKHFLLAVCVAGQLTMTANAMPTDAELEQSLQGNPEWRVNQAEAELSGIEADLQQSSPHEWQTGGTLQQRQLSTGGSTGEWTWRLERGWRLPGKGRLDRDIAASMREQAGYRRLDGVRTLKEEALGLWFDWAEAKARRALLVRQLQEYSQLLDKTSRLVRSGELSQRDQVQLQAEMARLQVQERESDRQEQMAEETLAHHYPGLMRIKDAGLPTPEAALPGEERMQQILLAQPAVKAVRSQVRTDTLRTDRASAERLPDPVLGVFTARDGLPVERVVGVSVSVPLGGERRRILTREAQARLAQTEARQAAEMKMQEHELDQLLAEVRFGLGVWEQSQQGLQQARQSAAMAGRAWELGEGDLQEASLARRLSLEAEDAELRARLRLLRAQSILGLRGGQA